MLETILSVQMPEAGCLHPTCLVLLLAVVLLVILLRLECRKGRWGAEPPLPPGPWGLPVLGHLLQLGRAPHLKLTAWWRHYGPVYRIRMGRWRTVVISGREAVRQAAIRQADDFAGRPAFYTFAYIAGGRSMGFCDYGARWRLHRKIAQNALATITNSRAHPMLAQVQAEAAFLADTLVAGGAGGRPYDPRREIYLSIGNIICVTCFGRRHRRDDPEFAALTGMNDDFMAYAGAGNPVDVLPWTRHFTKASFGRFVETLGHMTAFCDKKRDEHATSYRPDVVRDVTDALLRAARETPEQEKQAAGLTDSHIMTTLEELIAAGFDTIATTLHWAVLLMATHPGVQRRAQAEIASFVGGRDVTAADVNRLPYTEACLLEILRHSCIFPLALPHSATADTTLMGFRVPKGTLVFLNMWSLHHDPAVFPDPGAFNPSRFLTRSGAAIDKCQAENLFPFGVGRRRCPGEQLAKLELFIFFITLLQRCNFRASPAESYTLRNKFGLILKPAEDYKVLVEPRR